jgi:hypothetical protein
MHSPVDAAANLSVKKVWTLEDLTLFRNSRDRVSVELDRVSVSK